MSPEEQQVARLSALWPRVERALPEYTRVLEGRTAEQIEAGIDRVISTFPTQARDNGPSAPPSPGEVRHAVALVAQESTRVREVDPAAPRVAHLKVCGRCRVAGGIIRTPDLVLYCTGCGSVQHVHGGGIYGVESGPTRPLAKDELRCPGVRG